MNHAGILYARLLLDAARHVDSKRPHRLHRFRDVLRGQSAGEDHFGLARELRGAAPVRQFADAARGSLEDDARRERARRLAAEPHDRKHLDVRRDLELAQILDIGLKIVGLQHAADLVDLHLQRMLSDRDAQDSGRRERRELRRLPRRHLPRARREHEPDRVHPGLGRGADRIGAGDAANLDEHGAECSHLGLHCPGRGEDFATTERRDPRGSSARCR